MSHTPSRILNAATLTDHGHIAGRELMLELLEVGLRAANPYYAIQRLMRLEGDLLIFDEPLFEPEGSPRSGPEVVDLRTTGRIYVFGAGKGIQFAAKAIEDLLGDRLTGGCVIDKHGHEVILARIEVVHGAHPVPDEGCGRGCERIIELARDLRPEDLVITVMGNGVSSLLTLPAPGVKLEDIQRVTYMFQIERGGPTGDLVPIRNHLDAMKGGQYSRYLRPARMINLLCFSRMSYHDLLYSGKARWLHCLPDESTNADAIRALKKWDVWDDAPAAVRDFLRHSERTTLSVAEFEAMQPRVFCTMPAELDMVPTVAQKLAALGITPHVLFHNPRTQLEASQAGKFAAAMAVSSECFGVPFKPPCALLSSGEMLVTVGKEKGMGGRNQEYALAAAPEIANTHNIIIGSVDSDGTDGPGHQFVAGHEEIPTLTGGIVDGATAPRAVELGIDLHDALKRHATSPALWQLGDAVYATPGLSIGDLSVVLILE